ncbi:hypothetical protein ACFLV6_00670 [Chloroflexota bacterium]
MNILAIGRAWAKRILLNLDSLYPFYPFASVSTREMETEELI